MVFPLKVVAVSGSVFTPSRTLTLVNALIEDISSRFQIDSRIIQLQDIARETGQAFSRAELPAHIEDILGAIESADLLIVGSPVYKGSLPGQLKHLLDLIDQNALKNVPVILTATGGSDRHALIIDHQLRPIFAFFQALTLPVGIYANPSDFDGIVIQNPFLKDRILQATSQLERHFPNHLKPHTALAAHRAA